MDHLKIRFKRFIVRREGKSIEEIAAIRWGSLQNFQKLLAKAEGRAETEERKRSRSRSSDRKRSRDKRRSRSRSRSRDRSRRDRRSRSRSRDRRRHSPDRKVSSKFTRPDLDEDRGHSGSVHFESKVAFVSFLGTKPRKK